METATTANPRGNYTENEFNDLSEIDQLRHQLEVAEWEASENHKKLMYRIKRADIASMEIAELKELVRTDQCDENHTISKDFIFNKLDKIEI